MSFCIDVIQFTVGNFVLGYILADDVFTTRIFQGFNNCGRTALEEYVVYIQICFESVCIAICIRCCSADRGFDVAAYRKGMAYSVMNNCIFGFKRGVGFVLSTI